MKMYKSLSRVTYQTWLLMFVLSGIICIFSLRHNNQTMVELRNDVYEADKNNGDVNMALNDLRRYVYGHMNTNLSSGNNNIKPPIQLKYTYQRLLENEQAKIESKNSQIYTDAQNYCQSINNAYYGTTRVPCVQNYVVTHGVDTTLPTIPPGLYQFDFVSPAWSPDLAGFSLIASILFFAGFIRSYIKQKFMDKK